MFKEFKEFAVKGNVLIRGWGATLLLRSVSHIPCVHVCAPMELRVKRLMERLETDDEELARREIQVDDAARRARMGEYFNVDWGDPALYDLTLESLVPYDSVISAAIAALEEAVTIAEANPTVVRFPGAASSSLWFNTASDVSNAQFIELANTLAARFLVLSARNPAERAAVDWNQVLAYSADGLTSDFEFQLSNQRQSGLLNHFTNTPNGERNYR